MCVVGGGGVDEIPEADKERGNEGRSTNKALLF